MTRENGGPAFPVARAKNAIDEDYPDAHFPGMTLRDYFAAAALTSEVLARATLNYGDEKAVSERAYRYADAMLAERDAE